MRDIWCPALYRRTDKPLDERTNEGNAICHTNVDGKHRRAKLKLYGTNILIKVYWQLFSQIMQWDIQWNIAWWSSLAKYVIRQCKIVVMFIFILTRMFLFTIYGITWNKYTLLSKSISMAEFIWRSTTPLVISSNVFSWYFLLRFNR